MIWGTCTTQNCTVGVTGKCLEMYDPATQCPHFTPAERVNQTAKTYAPLGTAAARTFHAGNELGLQDALKITQGRYAHLIAILGQANAGKTCMLSALYLMACYGGLLPRFAFAGSYTLPGFEQRARGLRTWAQGRLPEQFTDHTHLDDPRQPGLLHLALADRKNSGERVELLLTDLPGEWTARLITQAQTSERFQFLDRADGVVIAIDGPKLVSTGQRQVELVNLRQLIDRLAQNVKLNTSTPLVLAVCKADELRLEMPANINGVADHAKEKGFDARPMLVASFSQNLSVAQNGHGVLEVIETVIDNRQRPAVSRSLLPQPDRSFGRSLIGR